MNKSNIDIIAVKESNNKRTELTRDSRAPGTSVVLCSMQSGKTEMLRAALNLAETRFESEGT